ncbi:MAG: hypothetical protein IKB02_05455 [Clostridia bacterium]|nr:hypothetical protein [Clostridia bacterium]
MGTTPNYDVNYDDKRFTQVNTEKEAALTDVEKTYGGMIDKSDDFYDKQIQAAKDYEKRQTEIQNQQTDFAIQKIEQQKDQAKKDYTKEQSGAYVDWQKQSNQYGANAEQIAAQGMTHTGYSESSQVSMYNTYQNRITTARESFNLAILNYNNAIKDARLQNSAALAEIAYQSLQKQLELSLAGFQYKNSLVTELAKTKREIDNEYNDRYQDVLKQINTENALAEEVRQYNATLAENQRQFNANKALQQAQLDLQKEQFAWQKAQAANSAKVSSGKSSSGGSSGGSKKPSVKSGSKQVKPQAKITNGNKGSNVSASDYINKLISSGANKDRVANEISLALREGAITEKEATQLRNEFTPRGIQWI